MSYSIAILSHRNADGLKDAALKSLGVLEMPVFDRTTIFVVDQKDFDDYKKALKDTDFWCNIIKTDEPLEHQFLFALEYYPSGTNLIIIPDNLLFDDLDISEERFGYELSSHNNIEYIKL